MQATTKHHGGLTGGEYILEVLLCLATHDEAKDTANYAS